jgi:hypothetical protein
MEHHRVVQRPAVQRVWVGEDRAGVVRAAQTQRRLQTSGGFQKQIEHLLAGDFLAHRSVSGVAVLIGNSHQNRRQREFQRISAV